MVLLSKGADRSGYVTQKRSEINEESIIRGAGCTLQVLLVCAYSPDDVTLTMSLSAWSTTIMLGSVGPKTSEPVVTDSDRSFLSFLGPLGTTMLSTEDSDGVLAGRL